MTPIRIIGLAGFLIVALIITMLVIRQRRPPTPDAAPRTVEGVTVPAGAATNEKIAVDHIQAELCRTECETAASQCRAFADDESASERCTKAAMACAVRCR